MNGRGRFLAGTLIPAAGGRDAETGCRRRRTARQPARLGQDAVAEQLSAADRQEFHLHVHPVQQRPRESAQVPAPHDRGAGTRRARRRRPSNAEHPEQPPASGRMASFSSGADRGEASRFGRWDPRVGSEAAAELRNSEVRLGGDPWGDDQPRTAYAAANLMMTAVLDNLASLGQLLGDQMPVIGLTVIARSAIEIAAGAWWLMEYGIGARRRVCRELVLSLTSARRAKQVADEFRAKASSTVRRSVMPLSRRPESCSGSRTWESLRPVRATRPRSKTSGRRRTPGRRPAALAHPGRPAPGRLRLHRGLVQHSPAPLRARLSQPRRIRVSPPQHRPTGGMINSRNLIMTQLPGLESEELVLGCGWRIRTRWESASRGRSDVGGGSGRPRCTRRSRWRARRGCSSAAG
jgi:hypothetical protein